MPERFDEGSVLIDQMLGPLKNLAFRGGLHEAHVHILTSTLVKNVMGPEPPPTYRGEFSTH